MTPFNELDSALMISNGAFETNEAIPWSPIKISFCAAERDGLRSTKLINRINILMIRQQSKGNGP